ncbi:MAG: hypothetical protein QXP04_05525 [Candidatus Nanoarchaeia archaeon]|nr:hypothetical protein [Candidatus Jingweiarchaeum tengchongense]
MYSISVIIATRNRWDASDDDKSKIVVEKFIQSHVKLGFKTFPTFQIRRF